MTDKEKRLLEILDRKGLKKRLKPVWSLDEARLILIKDKFVTIDEYIKMLETGIKFSEEDIYYLTL